MAKENVTEMAAALKIGQLLKGKHGAYTLTKEVHKSIWVALNQNREKVIVKSVRHWRERDLLLRYQHRTSAIRPFLDEIREPTEPRTIVLRYLDDDLLNASNSKRLTRPEVKHVGRRILEALKVLHEDGLVHTDIKPSNILVNYGEGEQRCSDVQVADLDNTISADSHWAQEGGAVGAPIFDSPEVLLSIPWNTSTDIWSFGATLLSLLYGGGFHVFQPKVPFGHSDYEAEILLKQHRIFGPFPASYDDRLDDMRRGVMAWLYATSPEETMKPFAMISETEVCDEDRLFLLKVMKLDPRDRPTAQQLLQDEWFYEVKAWR